MTSHLLPTLLPLGCIVCWTSAALAALPLLAVRWKLLKRGSRGASQAPLPGGVTTPPRPGLLHRMMHLLRACRKCRLYGVEVRAEENSGCSCPSCSTSSAAHEGVGEPTPVVNATTSGRFPSDKPNLSNPPQRDEPIAVTMAAALYRLGWLRRALGQWVDPVDQTVHTLEEAYAKQAIRAEAHTVVGVMHCTTPNIQFVSKGSPMSAHFIASGTHQLASHDPIDALNGAHFSATIPKATKRHMIPVLTERGELAYWMSKRSPEEILRSAKPVRWWKRAWRWATSWSRRRTVAFDIETQPFAPASSGGLPWWLKPFQGEVRRGEVRFDSEGKLGQEQSPETYLLSRGWRKSSRMEWHFHEGRWSRVTRVRWDDPEGGDIGWPLSTAIDMQRSRDVREAEQLRRDHEAQLREDKDAASGQRMKDLNRDRP